MPLSSISRSHQQTKARQTHSYKVISQRFGSSSLYQNTILYKKHDQNVIASRRHITPRKNVKYKSFNRYKIRKLGQKDSIIYQYNYWFVIEYDNIFTSIYRICGRYYCHYSCRWEADGPQPQIPGNRSCFLQHTTLHCQLW